MFSLVWNVPGLCVLGQLSDHEPTEKAHNSAFTRAPLAHLVEAVLLVTLCCSHPTPLPSTGP